MATERKTIAAVKGFIREPYAFPGGYPKALFMSDGELLCPKCAKTEFRRIVAATLAHDRGGWQAAGVDILWEGPDECCAHCGTAMPTAYGDPDEQEQVP